MRQFEIIHTHNSKQKNASLKCHRCHQKCYLLSHNMFSNINFLSSCFCSQFVTSHFSSLFCLYIEMSYKKKLQLLYEKVSFVSLLPFSNTQALNLPFVSQSQMVLPNTMVILVTSSVTRLVYINISHATNLVLSSVIHFMLVWCLQPLSWI